MYVESDEHALLVGQIAALQAEGESEAAEMSFAIAQQTLQEQTTQQSSQAMAQPRGGAASGNGRIKEEQLPT